MSAFLSALKAKQDLTLGSRVPPAPKKVTSEIVVPEKITDPIVTIDRVINRNRIDVFFSVKPSVEILDSLKAHGFRFRPSDKAWYHADTMTNRIFLHGLFGAEFDDTFTPNEPISEPTTEVESPVVELNHVETDPPTLNFEPHYLRYKAQVNELLEALKIEPADLMLMAIDSLHKTTFSKDS